MKELKLFLNFLLILLIIAITHTYATHILIYVLDHILETLILIFAFNLCMMYKLPTQELSLILSITNTIILYSIICCIGHQYFHFYHMNLPGAIIFTIILLQFTITGIHTHSPIMCGIGVCHAIIWLSMELTANKCIHHISIHTFDRYLFTHTFDRYLFIHTCVSALAIFLGILLTLNARNNKHATLSKLFIPGLMWFGTLSYFTCLTFLSFAPHKDTTIINFYPMMATYIITTFIGCILKLSPIIILSPIFCLIYIYAKFTSTQHEENEQLLVIIFGLTCLLGLKSLQNYYENSNIYQILSLEKDLSPIMKEKT